MTGSCTNSVAVVRGSLEKERLELSLEGSEGVVQIHFTSTERSFLETGEKSKAVCVAEQVGSSRWHERSCTGSWFRAQ